MVTAADGGSGPLVSAQQVVSSKWSELVITAEDGSPFSTSARYTGVFPTSGSESDEVVLEVTLKSDGRPVSVDGTGGILDAYTAVDLDRLVEGGYLATLPEAADRTSDAGVGGLQVPNFLWLFEKTDSSLGEKDDRRVVAFHLVNVEQNESLPPATVNRSANLVYRQIAGPEPGSSIVNPGFEIGDLTGWDTVIPSGGSVEILTREVGGFGPREGSAFTRLETDGPGSYTTLSQTLSVRAGDTLSGWAFFKTPESPSSSFNDHAEVRIRSSGTTVATVFSASVESVGSAGETPWTRWEYTFAESGLFTVEARVTNEGDSVGDSHMGLDGLVVGP